MRWYCVPMLQPPKEDKLRVLPGFSRRNFLRASVGLAMTSLSDLASHWAGRLGLSRAVADTGQVVRTQDLRLDARELAGGSQSGTRVAS